jgi:acyl-CoA synthetase (AMP-forming)/AMP-acid ligase II
MGLIACFLMPLMQGIEVIHMDPFHWLSRPVLLFELIDSYGGTLVWLPNFAFEHLAAAVPAGREFRLDSVRAFINCSEPCRVPTFRRFVDRFRSAGLRDDALQCCYAAAESTFAISQTELGKEVRRVTFDRDSVERGRRVVAVDAGHPQAVELLSNGRAIKGIECRVQDPVGIEAPEGTVGQIVMRGRFVFDGYFKNPELTSERLHDGWYDTHDIGFFHDGELFVLGRTDDVIICNGKNVFAHDVEGAASGVAGLKPGRCVAVPVDDRRSGTQKFAVIAERESDDPAILREARLRLQSNVMSAVAVAPYDIRFVPQGWLVKTTSGKISRKENLAKYLAEVKREKAMAQQVS